MSLLAKTEQRPAILAVRGRSGRDPSDVLDVVLEAPGLLIEEGAGPGRAVAVGLVVGDAEIPALRVALEEEDLGGFAADLEEGADVGGDGPGRGRQSAELVLAGHVDQRAEQGRAGAGGAHGVQRTAAQILADLAQEILGRLDRTPARPPVGRDDDRGRADAGEVEGERDGIP